MTKTVHARLDRARAVAACFGLALICEVILLGALSLALQMQREMIAGALGQAAGPLDAAWWRPIVDAS